MTAKLLAAKPVVEQIKSDLLRRTGELKRRGITPTMSVILVGDNPASLSYVRNKKKMCEEIGANFILAHLPADIGAESFLKKVEELNADKNINGIIIQLPVASQLTHLNLPNLVSPKKDIDGFHGLNTQKLYSGSKDLGQLFPCTPKGIIRLLKFYGIEISGKNIVVVGRSLIVGKPMSLLLSNFDATVTMANSKTVHLKKFTQTADIVISAIGKAHFFDSSYFSSEKKTVVIDVGMNTLDGKLTGDVNPEVINTVSAITPVPGGVGPMTVISLIENLITATENQLKD
ncbi:MAG: bifunctional 5,10-methylenetetrahydrofolate dehydrogenase/5,10-methenyltetrahydrofolate cyclohydrolase [Bacteriovoracaceae bacterium]